MVNNLAILIKYNSHCHYESMSVLNVDEEHLEADADLVGVHVEAHHAVPLPVPDTLAPDQAALPILLLRQWSMMILYKCCNKSQHP